ATVGSRLDGSFYELKKKARGALGQDRLTRISIRISSPTHLPLRQEQFHCSKSETKSVPNPDVVQKSSGYPTTDCFGSEARETGQFLCAQKNVWIVFIYQTLL